MTLVWLTVVIGVFNICLGFALGIYVHGGRQAARNPLPDDGYAPYQLPEDEVADILPATPDESNA